MTELEAIQLLDELRSTFPNTQLGNEGARQYVRALKGMSYELGREAVTSSIGSCRFLPTIADLGHHYGIAREQRRRQLEQERRREERIHEDNLPHPPLADIPDVSAYLAKLRGVDEQLHLERVSDGKCDDCAHVGARFKFAKLALCSEHVASRLRVKAQVDQEAA